MAVNKVIYGGNTLVDLTGDTVTAADLADGVKATGADGNPIVGIMQKVTIDVELSTTSTNPIQNKVIKAALDGKLGKNDTAAAAIKDGAGNTIAATYVKRNTANDWYGIQKFNKVQLDFETYSCNQEDGSVNTPEGSVVYYTITEALTLDLANLASNLESMCSTVFTAYIESNADYSLTITNAGTLKYVGSASDIAITSAGLLLNILMIKDSGDNVTSIVQASKLS